MNAAPRRLICLILCLALALGSRASAANPKPLPTKADIPFGPHPRQLLDVYLPPEGKGPFPVVIWYGTLWSRRRSFRRSTHFFRHNARRSLSRRA